MAWLAWSSSLRLLCLVIIEVLTTTGILEELVEPTGVSPHTSLPCEHFSMFLCGGPALLAVFWESHVGECGPVWAKFLRGYINASRLG